MLTDAEIQELLTSEKVLPRKVMSKLAAMTQSARDPRSEVKFRDANGRKFSILATKNKKPGSFSIHLRYFKPGRKKPYTLIRCNWGHGPHPNALEGTTVPAGTPHIHMLTERYQKFSEFGKEQTYAEATDEFNSMESAIEHICRSYGCRIRGVEPRQQTIRWE